MKGVVCNGDLTSFYLPEILISCIPGKEIEKNFATPRKSDIDISYDLQYTDL